MSAKRKNMKVTVVKGIDDNSKIKLLRKMAERHGKGRVRERVCFQVESQQMLRMLQTQELGYGIAERLEIHPFSFEELWAQRMFVTLPRRRVVSKPLDWEPMRYASEKRVHIVIFGLNSMTEAIIHQACLVCHYPNFVRDESRKTCITVIDPTVGEDDNLLLRRYGVLMGCCRWNYVDGKGRISQHVPECDYLGGEFTDMEFRIVGAEPTNVLARMLMTEVARDEREVPTIVIGGENGEKNWDIAMGLPAEYYAEGCQIPIYVRMKNSDMTDSATMLPQYRNIKVFGMDDCEYDLSMPLTRMAMGVAYIYNHCAETGLTTCDTIEREKAQAIWNGSKSIERHSSKCSAMSIMTNLRSLGKTCEEELTEEEVEYMSKVEHNRWSVERLVSGVRPVTREEQREIDADRSLKKRIRERGAHYDLRPYEALKEDFNGRNVQLYDECMVRGVQTIVKTFEENDGGEEMMVVRRENHVTESKIKYILKWAVGVAAALALLMFVGKMWVDEDERMAAYAKEEVGRYVYRLAVDSIEVWNGDNNMIERVLHRDSTFPEGTAFSIEGVGIVTARHCVEYWLYDNLKNLSKPEKWSPAMRQAIEVETYNDTTHGEKKRMVAICSLYSDDGSLYMDRVVFEIDQSRDRVHNTEYGMWRYVIPVFEGDREMLLSDYAVFPQQYEMGIRLADIDEEMSGKVCALGYPDNGGSKILISHANYIENAEEGTIRLKGRESHGISGGPVVRRRWFHYEVIGIMSRNDERGGENSWATIVNIKKEIEK